MKRFILGPWRRLWKNPSTTIINLAGLSVGMAATVLILLWVQNEVTYDSYHTDAERIYRITNHSEVSSGVGNTWISELSPYVYGTEAQKKIAGIENVARIKDASWNPLIFKINDELFSEKRCAYVDSNWFNMFHYEILAGSLKAFSQTPTSIALTETKAKKYFGNADVIGKVIQVDTVLFTVRAVLKENPSNSSFQYDILLPVSSYFSNPQNANMINTWGGSAFMTFLKLHKGAKQAVIEKNITALLRDNKKTANKNSNWTTLVGLPDMHFETTLATSAIKHTDKKTVTIFSILAVLILLTACINYVNLTTARASLRAKEVSIRKIVGAAKWQLYRQFIWESFMISLCALSLTILLVQGTLPFFNRLMEIHITAPFDNPQLWKTLLSTLLFTTVMSGIYPAVLLSSFKPLNVFRGITILKVKDVYLRKGLVVVQFCISVILIAGTIVIFQQMQFIQKENGGYNKAQVLNIRVPVDKFRKMPARGAQFFIVREQENAFIETLKADLQQESSIAGVSIAQTDIIDSRSQSSGGFDWDGKPKDYDPSISGISADPDFFKMFNLELKEGRWYRNDKADERSFILNETAVQELGIHQPALGQRFIHESDSGTIIGIAKDFHFQSMHDKIGPMIMYNRPYWRQNMYINIRPGQSGTVLQILEKKWRALFPGKPFEYNFLDEKFDQLYSSDRRTSYLILIFSLIAIFISVMGLFGLTAFAAERRVKEIGIRKVLGATIGNIVSLLSKEFVWLVITAIVLAIPVAWILMNKWLENFAYRIDISAWILLSGGILAMIIALVTVSIQAIRAGMANPVKSLRTE